MDGKKNIWIILRRIAAGCIDWPLAFIIAMMCPLSQLGAIYFIIVIFTYFALFECSKLQATPGKMLFGLKVSDSHGEPISIWQVIMIRLLQCLAMVTLFYVTGLIESLSFLMNWNFRWQIIFLVLLGLFYLGYWINFRFLKLKLNAIRDNERIVSRRVKETTKGTGTTWSLQKVLAFNLTGRELLFGFLASIIIVGLPYIHSSFADFVYNRPGVIKGQILYYSKNIPEDTVINKDDLEIREMGKARIPEDALRSPDQAIGHLCKYGALAGEIVSRHDIKPSKEPEQK